MTLNIETLTLKAGGHRNIEQGACLLEAASYLAGEPWSDQPACVSPVIGAYGRRLNDRLGDTDRQKLKPFLPAMLNTADDGQDEARRWMLVDWSIRVGTPRWLEAAGLTERADELRALPQIVDEATARDARTVARAARDDAYAARLRSRNTLTEKIKEELAKRGMTVAAAVADAVADADADAVTVAVADAVADADADAVADAVAVADADAVAVAAAAAVADADADAAAVKYSPSWWDYYYAIKAKLIPIYRDAVNGSKFAEVRDLNNADAIALLGKIIDPKANAL